MDKTMKEEIELDMRVTAPGAKNWLERGSLWRERKPLSYVRKEDLDQRSRKRGKTMGGG